MIGGLTAASFHFWPLNLILLVFRFVILWSDVTLGIWGVTLGTTRNKNPSSINGQSLVSSYPSSITRQLPRRIPDFPDSQKYNPKPSYPILNHYKYSSLIRNNFIILCYLRLLRFAAAAREGKGISFVILWSLNPYASISCLAVGNGGGMSLFLASRKGRRNNSQK